ncbi:dihydrolipoamide succinyltransferase, partial [Paenibacillus riograndensis]
MSEIKVPDLGESISEGTIYKWLVKEGDTVGQGDVLAELETDKVNLEISAEEDGVISSILRQAGENVAVGETIGIIGSGAGPAGAAPPQAAHGRHPAPASVGSPAPPATTPVRPPPPGRAAARPSAPPLPRAPTAPPYRRQPPSPAAPAP